MAVYHNATLQAQVWLGVMEPRTVWIWEVSSRMGAARSEAVPGRGVVCEAEIDAHSKEKMIKNALQSRIKGINRAILRLPAINDLSYKPRRTPNIV